MNKLTSTKTQLPYEWYSLPFCQPADIQHVAANLGEVMRGDRIVNSPYDIKMNHEESCKVLCEKNYGDKEAGEFVSKIEEARRATLRRRAPGRGGGGGCQHPRPNLPF